MMLQVTDGVTADGNTMSLLTVTGATFADNGVYTCTVTFGFYGAATAAEVSNLLPITTTRVILYYCTIITMVPALFGVTAPFGDKVIRRHVIRVTK